MNHGTFQWLDISLRCQDRLQPAELSFLSDGGRRPIALGPASPYRRDAADAATFPRIAYAAAHVVADPLAMSRPWQAAAVDWDATLAFRHHLWGLGFKIAEAMDTSQRGMGLDWPTRARADPPLARRGADRSPGADLACGVGTDQLAAGAPRTLDDVVARL